MSPSRAESELTPPAAAPDTTTPSAVPPTQPNWWTWAQAHGTVRSAAWIGWAVGVLVTLSFFLLDVPVGRWGQRMAVEHRTVVDVLRDTAHGTKYYVAAVVLLVLCLWRHWWRGGWYSLTLLLGLATSGLGNFVLKMLLARWRPARLWNDGHWGFTFFAEGYSHNSFPSGHATTAGAVATVLILRWPRAWPAWVLFGVFAGGMRVVADKHFVSDVSAGLFVGAVGMLATACLLAHVAPWRQDAVRLPPEQVKARWVWRELRWRHLPRAWRWLVLSMASSAVAGIGVGCLLHHDWPRWPADIGNRFMIAVGITLTLLALGVALSWATRSNRAPSLPPAASSS